MSFNSMADNYRHNQSVKEVRNDQRSNRSMTVIFDDDYKSNYNTYINKSKTRIPWRIFCYDWKSYTESIESIIIRRYNIQSFGIFATCDICKTFKTLALKDFYYEKFPRDYFNFPLGKQFMNDIITNKGEIKKYFKRFILHYK